MGKAGLFRERARWLQAGAAGFAVALLVLAVRHLGWLDLWEYRTRDLRTRWTLRGEGLVRDDVRLVMISDHSIDRVHQNNDVNFPWDWDFYGLLIKAAAEGKAAGVLFDLLLSETRDGEKALAAALRAGPPAYLAGFFREHDAPRADLDERLARHAIPVESDGSVQVAEPYTRVIPPTEGLAGSIAGVCGTSTPRDGDGLIRRYPLLFRHRGRWYPSMALAGLMVREGVKSVSIRSRSVHVGKLALPVERDGAVLLRYYPLGESFRWNHAWTVLNRMMGSTEEKFEPSELKGAVVIVGVNASAFTDLRVTPLSPPEIAGAEIHAVALANLLSGDYLREASPAVGVFLVVLLALGTAAFTRFSSASLGGAAAAALLAAFGLASVLLYRSRWIVDVVAPMGAVVLAFASTSAVNFLYEGRQRLRTKREFQRYMSPKVVEKVLKNPDAMSMAGERKVISIFFMDFAGFTSMSEKLDAVEVVRLMNDYHNEAAEEIFRTEGTLDKFIGDAIMAFWNDPIEQPDHALRACTTAIQAQKRLVVMAERMRERGLPAMTARIGINTGIATMGNMGAKVQFQYTAIGDEVNLASRLEGVNKEFGTRIIVAEPTLQAAKDAVEARELALIKVKGKKQPVRIYELLGLKGELASGAVAAARDFETALHDLHQRRFAGARDAFRALAAKGDAPAALYVEVCTRYLGQAPPADWDGSYQMEHK
jgi:adenylate cyclase